jgi:hypothetical protein
VPNVWLSSEPRRIYTHHDLNVRVVKLSIGGKTFYKSGVYLDQMLYAIPGRRVARPQSGATGAADLDVVH